MNRKIRQLAAVLIGLYVVLFVAMNYWQIGRTEELASELGNTRAAIRLFDTPRGPIVTADGVTVAYSVQSPGDSDVTYLRRYPTSDLFAHIAGYYTFGLGMSQLERTENDVLTGGTMTQQIRALEDILSRNSDQSGSIVLTMRDDIQSFAREQLGEREGSIVVLDTDTGGVVAMWSWPSYDPNRVADEDYDAAYEYMTLLQADTRDPLLGNAYQQRYMPGSTFKVLTTGIALDDGVITTESYWPPATEFIPPQTTDPIGNYNGTTCGGDLYEVFVRSCNIPFAQIALELGPERFEAGTGRWGVDTDIPFDLPRGADSTIGDFSDIEDNLPLLAISGFGQANDQMVPLHMAMVASTVANDGQMLEPYVVDQRLDHNGALLSQGGRKVWRAPITAGTAGILQDLMVGVATEGTASCCIALDNGISVAAKTGTAQLNGPGEPERSHAWIIAYAPVEDPRYAVAVMLKGTNAEISASTGGRLAGPIAKAMLDEVFARDAEIAAAAAAAPASTSTSAPPSVAEPGAAAP